MSNLSELFSELSILPPGVQERCCKIIRLSLALHDILPCSVADDHTQYERMVENGAFTRTVLGEHVQGILTRSENGLLIVDPEDYGVGIALRAGGGYSTFEINYFKKYLKKDQRLLVVGAHIGSLAIPLAAACKEVIAIEANPDTFELLKLNLLINQVANCSAVQIAANDKTEELTFLLNKANSGGSKRKPRINDHMYYYDHPKEVRVPSFALDDYFSEENFEMVIMDIEGSEYFALKGMERILSKAQILVMEFVPHHLKNVAGIELSKLTAQLQMFDSFTLLSKDVTVSRENFGIVLEYLFDNDISEDGIIFRKH